MFVIIIHVLLIVEPFNLLIKLLIRTIVLLYYSTCMLIILYAYKTMITWLIMLIHAGFLFAKFENQQ